MSKSNSPSVGVDAVVIPTEGCICQGCGKIYKVDIIVPDEIWKIIKPQNKPDEGGLLCGMCIMQRIEDLNRFGGYELRSV